MKGQAVLKREEKKVKEIVFKKGDRPESLKLACYFAIGLLTGLFPEKYVVSPFCPAFTAAAGEYGFIVFLGGTFGYIISRGVFASLRYILLLGVIAVGVTVLEKKLRTVDPLSIAVGFSAVPVFAFHLGYALLGEFRLLSVIFALADAMLCAGGVYFFKKSIHVIFSQGGLKDLTSVDAFCLAVSGGALLSSISFVKIMNISPAHILAGFIILFSAYYKKSTGGSIMGIILGTVLSISGDIHLLYMYAISGLILGIMSPLGQYFQAVTFVIISAAVSLVMQGDINGIYTLIETAVAAIAFISVPGKVMNRIYDCLEKNGLKTDSRINMQTAARISTAADTVMEIGNIVSQVTEQMDTVVNPEITKVYAKIQHKVCTDCQHKCFCWQDNFANTVKDIEEIGKLSPEKISATDNKLPGGLETLCPKLSLLFAQVKEEYRNYTETEDYRLKIDEMRSIVTDQFSSMSLMLSDISKQLSNAKMYNENKSRAIKLALCESGVVVHSCTYYENEFSRATVEIGIYEEPDKINCKKIQSTIWKIAQKNFKLSETAVIDFVTMLTFSQKPQYDINRGFKQIPKGNNTLCGDQFEEAEDVNGNLTVILSDGMGTGKRAAIDATMTCSLMQKLLCSGFTFESALNLVNSALLIKSRDESLSTVDMVSFNTYSGVCDFYKAGATLSYIRHTDGISRVCQSSMPVGILRETETAHSVAQLKKGDIILMLSDGVVSDDNLWIEEELLSWSTDNMEELATHIADMAKLKSLPDSPDDITVIALKVKGG